MIRATKHFLIMLSLFTFTVLIWAIIICIFLTLTGCNRQYESGFYKVNNKIVYCRSVIKDYCGLNLFECNDFISRYCANNVEILSEVMAKEMQKPKVYKKEIGKGIIKYDKKGRKK